MIRLEMKTNDAPQATHAVATAQCLFKQVKAFLPSLTIALTLADAGPDGAFEVALEGRRVEITGSDEGLRCGLYTLLNHLGIHWFNPAEEIVLPTAPVEVDLQALVGHYAPDFSYRGLHICAGEHHFDDRVAAWMSFNRMNRKLTHLHEDDLLGERLRALGLRPDTTVHAYDLLIPDETYFDTHPEFFALVGGKRIRQREGGQLCLSNRAMRQAFAEELLAIIRHKPHIGVFGFCPNDGYGHCECAGCLALDTEKDRQNNGVNGRVADFVQAICQVIAKEAPGVMLGHYSYSNFADFMELLPEPPKNLLISFTQFHCYRHAITDPACEVNRPLHQRLEHILTRVEHVYIYDYYGHRGGYLPFPVWDAQVADFQYWKRLNVAGFMSEVSGAAHESWQSFWPAYYLASRLLWNAETDWQTEVAAWCRTRYGKASEPMEAYFGALQDAIGAMLGCFRKDPGEFPLYFTQALRRQCAAFLEEAERHSPGNALLQAEHRLFAAWCANADARARYHSDLEITARPLADSAAFRPQNIHLVHQGSQLPDLDNDTQVEVAMDAKQIRIRVKLLESSPNTLKRPGDAGHEANKVYGSENVEIFLDDGLDHEKCYHYLIGIQGGVAASECVGPRWNWAWEHHADVQVTEDTDGWHLVMTLPKSDIHAGERFGLTVIRNRYAGGSWQVLGVPGGGAFFDTRKYLRVKAASE